MVEGGLVCTYLTFFIRLYKLISYIQRLQVLSARNEFVTPPLPQRSYSDLMFYTETVLTTMIRSFRFSVGDKEVYWNMAGVTYPTVGKESDKPAAYLRVERIR